MKPPQCAPGWTARPRPLAARDYSKFDGVLQIVAADSIDKKGGARRRAFSESSPFADLLSAAKKKRGGENPAAATLENGSAVVRLEWKKTATVFQQMENVRRHLSPLAECNSLAVDLRLHSFSSAADSAAAAEVATTAALIMQARLPGDRRRRCDIVFAGAEKTTAEEAAIFAEANTLTRALCRLPSNELTPPTFAAVAKNLAAKHSALSAEIVSEAQLKKMGAGLILAVGAAGRDAPRIVRLRYRGMKNAKAAAVALVGKGVCYDTGGINVKPARHMRGMKGDMAGAAAVLSALVAAARLRLPLNIDGYLALADNSVSPLAYRPDDVVAALNGKRVEIVHSDAEGRMLLADTLTLATSCKPPPLAVASLATLTGTMQIALGERISGFFCENEKWRKHAEAAADSTGERLCFFPIADDYKTALKSDIADIKQCAEQGDADHMMAALFLREFLAGSPPWLHLDLSATSCKEGLAAAPGPDTGFGALWLLEFLKIAALPGANKK